MLYLVLPLSDTIIVHSVSKLISARDNAKRTRILLRR